MTKEEMNKYISYDSENGIYYRLPHWNKINMTLDRRTRIDGKKYTFGAIASILMGEGNPYPHRMLHLDNNNNNYKWNNLKISFNVKKEREALGLGSRGHTKIRLEKFITEKDNKKYLECSCCFEVLELNEINFQKRKDNILGWRRQCKECIKISKKKDSDNPITKRQKSSERLYKKYGITIDDYDNMYKFQNGLCKICSDHKKMIGTGSNYSDVLVIDHNHDTHKIRGLLCQRCNRSIGMMKDNIEILKSAIIYLKDNND